MARLSESDLEAHALDVLRDLGHISVAGSTLDPETSSERSSYHGAILEARFLAALRRLNPNAPDDALQSVFYTLRDNANTLP